MSVPSYNNVLNSNPVPSANTAPIPRVAKSLDDCRRMLFARIEEVQDDYQAKGWLPRRLNLNKGVVRGLIELFAFGLYQLYQLLEATLYQAFPKHADADWLDLHADQVEQPRKLATKALGMFVFQRDAGFTGNIVIPAGRIVKTEPDGQGNVYRYITSAEAILPAGTQSVAVYVEAEEYGSAANLTAGQTVTLVTPVVGISGVSVPEGWLMQEGADTEADDKLKVRLPLAWQGNNGVTRYAYARWAMSVTGVVACRVLDNHPRGQGTVDVIVKGAAGIPTAELLDAVRAAIDGEYPVNDDWQVRGPQPVFVDIAATLTLYPDTVEDDAKRLAEERIRALFTDPAVVSGILPLQIGEDLTKDRLVAAVMAVSGVKSVTWGTLFAQSELVPVTEDGLAVLSSLNVDAVYAAQS